MEIGVAREKIFMASNTDTALTTTAQPSRPGPAPYWVWLLMLALVAAAVYASYFALSKQQLYFDAERTRQTLEMDKARLSSTIAALREELGQAGAARAETDTALQKMRERADAASAQVADLQAQVSAQQEKIKSLQETAAAAQESAKQATAAKTALERDVEGMKGRLNEIQSKLDSALTDLTSAQEQSQSQAPAP